MYHQPLVLPYKNISVMAKRINHSLYERQVLLVCVKEYANIIEDKRTDRRITNEKENALEICTRIPMSPRGPANSRELAGK